MPSPVPDGGRNENTSGAGMHHKHKKQHHSGTDTKAPAGMSADDWAVVQHVARRYGIDPMVLVAIGVHETQWGSAGAGREGYILGVGVPDSGGKKTQYQGLHEQLVGAAKILNNYGVHTIKDLATGVLAPHGGHVRYASDTGWTSNVVAAYNDLSGGKSHITVDASAIPGGGGSGPGVSNTSPHLSTKDLAARYGFSASFFKEDPSLEKLIHQAVKGQWDRTTFVGHLKDTAWYQSHDASQRKWTAMQDNDPAEAQHQMKQRVHDLRQMSNELGVDLSSEDLRAYAEKSLLNGLTSDQMQQGLASHLQYVKGSDFAGLAGTTQDQLTQTAADFGIGMSGQTVASWVKNILEGNANQDDYTQHVQDMAKSAFPALGKLIDQGQTVRQIADPYVQQMAQTLELDPAAINFAKDHTLRGAFNYLPQGQNEPGLMPLWQFDQQVKQDPRWLKTDNARNSLMDVTTGVLGDWGLA